MAHLRSRRMRALAVPLGLALTASLGFLPNAATAASQDSAPAAAASADGPLLSYVVNTKPGHATVGKVKKAIAKAGGTVVIAYEQIGVIVVHSANPRVRRRSCGRCAGVQSAGATRTAPLKAQGTTDVGKPQKVDLPKSQLKAAGKAAKANGEEPLEPLQWDLPAIKADKAAKVNPGSKKVTVAVIDTGVDDTHPDLSPNFSAKQSANCVGGVADTTEGAWRPWTRTRTTTARMSRARSPRPATASAWPGSRRA